ncbi:uncharacterized protein LOC126768183 isoform X1 [Nymphalis io]|uniref:uncharacterized protein LOC126768183 isoform X1 n=1 Tax=Inachis io TaxID=171585 RepID=UPI002167206B|nr:uncharacterized protein LOC126768183 isoform X1 [Nymphalis io]
MRKTSHDGIDVTSITSGIENEIKKAGTKIKKTSKKRKVQNFSLESDENIIEPLLQIDNEKSEISSRSAKYLLNKTKTDSSFELVNKTSENSVLSANSISTPVNSTSKINTSYICGTAPLHNHMNTNIFGMYDVTTKNSILVEIDGSKSGAYNQSPMIFTTAKIHTDGKSKLMEPVQITPVPILSTIEGNVVRTFADNSEYHMSSLSPRPIDLNINKCCTSVTSELNESEIKNIKEIKTIHSVTDSTSTHNKNQSINKLSNKSCKPGNLPTSTHFVYCTTKTVKDDICLDNSTILTTANSMNNGINGENVTIKPMQLPIDVHVADNKCKKLKSPKAISDMQGNEASAHKYTPLCGIVEKHKKMSNTFNLTESSDDVTNTVKVSSSGSKRLQRQKNASIEDINETATISNTLTNKSDKSLELGKNNITANEKSSIAKDKSEDISYEKMSIAIKPITKTDTSKAVSIDAKPLGTISKQEMKSTTDVEISRPLTGSSVANGSKTLNKSSIMVPVPNAKDNIKSVYVTTEKSLCNVTVSSVNTSAMATFIKSDSLNLVPTKDDVLVKCETSAVTTTLPSYIVSTSRTKIGSTFTFSTITNTSKSVTQKPLDHVVYTTNEKEKKSTALEQGNKSVVGMPSNSTRNHNVSKQTESETHSSVKDGRA